MTDVEASPTRQELRAVLANPESTPKQVLQAKLVLAKRLANLSNALQKAYDKYRLTPEQIADFIAQRNHYSLEREAWAKEEMQRLEQSLAELRKE